MALIIEQPNVMQVIELRKIPRPHLMMKYYEHGNILKTCVTYDQYVTAFGQILNDLNHLHAKNIAHRDLKPENIFVEKRPVFKIVISDFGLFKVATNTTLLRTFCGTLKYFASEVFFDNNDGYKPFIDIWALGVIDFEWLYDISDFSTIPTPRENEKEVQSHQWHQWVDTWACSLLDKLKNEDKDLTIEILLNMIEKNLKIKWPADRCLRKKFENGLFERTADGLIVNARDIIKDASKFAKKNNEIGISSMILSLQIYYLQSDNLLPSESNKKRRVKRQISASIEHDIFESKPEDKSSMGWYTRYTYKEEKFRECTLNNQAVRMRLSDQWICFIHLRLAFGQSLTWIRIKLTTIRKKGQKEQKESTNPYYHALHRQGTLVDLPTALSYFEEFDVFKHDQLRHMIDDDIGESSLTKTIKRLVHSYEAFKFIDFFVVLTQSTDNVALSSTNNIIVDFLMAKNCGLTRCKKSSMLQTWWKPLVWNAPKCDPILKIATSVTRKLLGVLSHKGLMWNTKKVWYSPDI